MKSRTRILTAILCLAIVFGLAGCGSSGNQPLPAASAPSAPAEKAAPGTVACINCLVDGEHKVTADGNKHTAVVDLKEGKALDHWEINGITEESTAAELEFTADFTGYVKAMLRPEKTVTAINAHFHILDADGNPAGEDLTRTVFEHERGLNADGEEVEGIISFIIIADVPAGYKVDYWIINGAEYHFSNTENSFTVKNLTETRTYEVVLTADDGTNPPDDPDKPDRPVNPPIYPPERDDNPGSTHRHDYREIERSSPWCDEPGYIYYKCETCGDWYKEEYCPALGHDWESYIDASGVMQTRCRRCGVEPKG